ncbi:MAG: hypothetical protein JST54_02385 [Deltaproteobacteria bacterium]|nr:hypothetical protein [Deltaproteobacteria bacterium]
MSDLQSEAVPCLRCGAFISALDGIAFCAKCLTDSRAPRRPPIQEWLRSNVVWKPREVAGRQYGGPLALLVALALLFKRLDPHRHAYVPVVMPSSTEFGYALEYSFVTVMSWVALVAPAWFFGLRNSGYRELQNKLEAELGLAIAAQSNEVLLAYWNPARRSLLRGFAGDAGDIGLAVLQPAGLAFFGRYGARVVIRRTPNTRVFVTRVFTDSPRWVTCIEREGNRLDHFAPIVGRLPTERDRAQQLLRHLVGPT